jgi:hypothetical protein
LDDSRVTCLVGEIERVGPAIAKATDCFRWMTWGAGSGCSEMREGVLGPSNTGIRNTGAWTSEVKVCCETVERCLPEESV